MFSSEVIPAGSRWKLLRNAWVRLILYTCTKRYQAGAVQKVEKFGGGIRRPDRAMKISFLEKWEQLCLDLNLPLDIMKLEVDNIIQHPGIT